MRRLLLTLLSAVLLVPLLSGADGAGAAPPGGLRVAELRTEYAVNPIGLDTARPRLSWVLESSERAESQKAYQVRIATSRDRLVDDGEADVWDSGVVASHRSVNVRYDGPALKSGTRYFWAVRVWDADGDASPWSDPAWWATALLAQSDWQAEWIGAPRPEQPQPPTFSGTRWIWYPEGSPAQDAPAATRYFRRAVSVPADRTLAKAELLITADDQYVLYVNGAEAGRSSGQPDAWRQAAVVDVTKLLDSGANTFAVAATNSGGPASWIAKLRLQYADGGTAETVTDASWKTSREGPSGWQQPGYDDSAWIAAMDVAGYGDGPWGTGVQIPSAPPPPSPLLRTDFDVAKTVRAALVHVSGLGNYELRINGARVGDRVLAPGRNDYRKRVPYDTYDVTGLLRAGPNAIGAELGRGWYGLKQPNAWRWDQAPWIDEPKLRLQLELTYDDGSTGQVVTGTDWRVAEGPTRSDSVYGGETYDANYEKPGWDRPGYDDSTWQSAVSAAAPAGRMSAETTDPIRVVESITPTSVTSPKGGIHVVDMGRVMAGWARLSVSGPAGTKVTLRYGEKLNGDGTVQYGNGLVTGRHQTDEYVLRGDGTEVWEPKFSYKGFRYVQVEGLAEPPTVVGRLVHSDVANAGDFHSDNPLYGKIHAAMRRTVLNNLHGIPTDTPMYEKNGWTGDAQVGTPSMTYNFDMARFFTEWLDDIRDSQVDSGQIPVIVPSPGWGYNELAPAPEWTAVYPIVLWQMYSRYGDQQVLGDHFAALAKYVDWEIGRLDDGIARTALGDWASPGYDVPPEDTRLSASVYVYRSLTLTADIAAVLGRTADAERYRGVADRVRTRLNEVFLDRDAGHYRTAKDPSYRQANNLLPLAFGMVPQEYRTSVMDSVVSDIRARGVHLNTGALATSVLLPMLSAYGHHDLAQELANQTTYPSWGYWFANGADTMWEFWDLGARSRDHYFLGTIDEWFYEDLAGINPQGPGYREILIRPRIGGGLDEAMGKIQTGYGEIEVEWEAMGDRVKLEVTVPVNTTALVHVPTSDPSSVTEGGAAADDAQGVRFLRAGDGVAVYQVGSGKYTFEAAR